MDVKGTRLERNYPVQPTAVPRPILVVEDDEQSGLLTMRALQEHGYSPIRAGSAEQALYEISKLLPDAILLNIALPASSGLELLVHLRDDGRTRDLPILLMTDSAPNNIVPKALQLGASDYVPKPIDYPLLLLRLRLQLDASDRVSRLEARLRKVQKSGGRDEITGTADRAFALHMLELELRRAARYNRPVSVVMMDLDTQGRGEGTHEHQAAASDLMRHAAAVLGFTLRSTDVLARFQSLRFFAILPETTERQATRTADRLRDALESSPHRLQGINIRIVFNAGIASYTGHGKPPTAEGLVTRTEHALLHNRHLSQSGPGSAEELAQTTITSLEKNT